MSRGDYTYSVNSAKAEEERRRRAADAARRRADRERQAEQQLGRSLELARALDARRAELADQLAGLAGQEVEDAVRQVEAAPVERLPALAAVVDAAEQAGRARLRQEMVATRLAAALSGQGYTLDDAALEALTGGSPVHLRRGRVTAGGALEVSMTPSVVRLMSEDDEACDAVLDELGRTGVHLRPAGRVRPGEQDHERSIEQRRERAR